MAAGSVTIPRTSAMNDKKPPPSITAAILADPKSFLTPEQRQESHLPTHQAGDALADAKDAAAALKAFLHGKPVHVGDERSGQLLPPHTPSHER
jgi:hypothetical protein